MKRSFWLVTGLAVFVALAGTVRADDALNCFGEDIERRIEGCTALIERRDPAIGDLSSVYAMRALAYSLKGQYQVAISDYDVAINMRPDFAVALNNRAWAYFRWGKAATGAAGRGEVAAAEPDEPRIRSIPAPTSSRCWASPRRRCATTPRPCSSAARR